MVFTVLSLSDSIAVEGVNSLNYGINAAANYYSVIRRVQEVLVLKENKNNFSQRKLPKRVTASGFTASWKAEANV